MPDEAARQGGEIVDVAAFHAVFDDYWMPVVRYRSRRLGVDAGEQVAADVFAEAFVDRAHFDPRRGSVRAWLFGIASHLVALPGGTSRSVGASWPKPREVRSWPAPAWMVSTVASSRR